MKFEFILEEEWDTPPTPDPRNSEDHGGLGEQPESQPPSPAALIATAAERMHTRARFDSDRLHNSLNRMRYTVQTSLPPTEPSFADTDPELGVDVFRPQAFGGSRG